MNNIFNGIIEFFASILSKLSILLIVLILGLIIFSRIDKLFKMDILGEASEATERLILANNSEEEVESVGPAKIIYQGNIKPEDSLSAKDPIEEENPSSVITFEILEGQTPGEVAKVLQSSNLIQDPYTFVLLLQNNNLANNIVPGVYKVPENIKNMDLLAAITIAASTVENNGETNESIKLVTFEIKSGDAPSEVAKLLQDNGLIQDPPSLILLLEEKNLIDDIKPGVYNVPLDIKNADLIESITN